MLTWLVILKRLIVWPQVKTILACNCHIRKKNEYLTNSCSSCAYLDLKRVLGIVQKQHSDINNIKLSFSLQLQSSYVICTTRTTEGAPRYALNHLIQSITHQNRIKFFRCKSDGSSRSADTPRQITTLHTLTDTAQLRIIVVNLS